MTVGTGKNFLVAPSRNQGIVLLLVYIISEAEKVEFEHLSCLLNRFGFPCNK